MWDWEPWKAAQFDEMDDSDQRAATFLEKSRRLALAFPGLLGVGSYVVLDPTPLTGALEWTLFVTAVFALLWSVVLLLTYQSEVKGIPMPHHVPGSGKRCDSRGSAHHCE